MSYVPRLKEKYAKEVVPALKKQFEYKSSMQVPRLQKICINQGIGTAVSDKKLIDSALVESKKDISNFKLRKGVPIGIKVTLRGDKMYEFLDRLISVALPRIRDFRGVNEKSFDGKGNYTMGVTEQIIFPEIQIDKVNKIMGMDITFVTSSPTDAEAFALLKQFGIPFKNQKN
jgi:large subunit ribosomal protein L5